MKSLNRTRIKAEEQIKNHIQQGIRKEQNQQIQISVNALETSMVKLLESMTLDEIDSNREHLDNVFYHIGAIRGALSVNC